MRRTMGAAASLAMLAACSHSSDPVGENSADSIKTTAVGNVVASEPSPTPTPTVEMSNTAVDPDSFNDTMSNGAM